MVLIKVSNPIVNIERAGSYNKFSGKTKAKDFRSWVHAKIGLFSKKDNLEMMFIFKEILRAYNHYNPEKKVEVRAKQWKGKSSIEILKELDRLIIIKYQKPSPDEEPKEIRTEANKQELEALIYAIKSSRLEYIPTKELALDYCGIMNYNDMLNGEFWKNFFSNRPLHNKFTLMLNALQELGFVEYKGGKTKLLDKDLSIQLVL